MEIICVNISDKRILLDGYYQQYNRDQITFRQYLSNVKCDYPYNTSKKWLHDGILTQKATAVIPTVHPSKAPVEDLAFCDASTVSVDDLVAFEIRYADRVGENYFAGYSPAHRWWMRPCC